jgi:hypothetical protein
MRLLPPSRPGPRLPLLALVVLAGSAGPALAQFRNKVEILDAKVGLPPGPFAAADERGQAMPVYKTGTWGPIYLLMKQLRKVDGEIELVIKTTDSDDLENTYVVPVGLPEFFPDPNPIDPLKPDMLLTTAELPYMPYVRCGGTNAEVTIIVQDAKTGYPVSPPYKRRFFAKDNYKYVLMAVGSQLAGLRLPKAGGDGQTDPGDSKLGNRLEVAAVGTDVTRLPDQWFGYKAVDLLILGTGQGGTDPWYQQLFGDQIGPGAKRRQQAMLEWVRRGGHVVVSVGSNATLLAGMPAFQEFLPATLKRDDPVRNPVELKLEGVRKPDKSMLGEPLRPGGRGGVGKMNTLTVANLVPKTDRPVRVLVPEKTAGPPVILQAPYGLGRVTRVGFDLDQAPFVDWEQRGFVWDWILREAGSDRGVGSATQGQPNPGNPQFGGNFYSGEQDDERAITLQGYIDYFAGVPVISFGWVALFILLYIIIIGPVDYLFLKKVLGRLELTWVTFPLVVIAVSAVAYFAAYALKGNDLKINKVDVVDVDLGGQRLYGQTWFTVFSPRIENYTIGVEPSPQWTPIPPDKTARDTMVGWMGQARSGRSSLFRRTYRYYNGPVDGTMAFAIGLEQVPIQVWSTKAFSGSWAAPYDPKAPPIAHTLRHPAGDPDKLTGRITHYLDGVTLQDAHLIYMGNVVDLGDLTAGADKSVLSQKTGLQQASQWLQSAANDVATNVNQYNVRGARQQTTGPSNFNALSVMFHEITDGNRTTSLRNASLRDLDQSWRVRADNRDEAILVAKIIVPEGPAEPTATSAASPSRLWLRGIPGTTDDRGRPAERSEIRGTLKQDTYVRVFIPIAKAGDKE